MDEPLFGHEESRRDQTLHFLAGGSVALFTVLTIIFSIVQGFSKSVVHLFLGASIASIAACLVVLVRWFRNGDLDPKFKFLIAGIGASLTLLCIVANVYFWEDKNSGILEASILPK